MVTIGAGDYTYEVCEGWPRIPSRWSLIEVSGVAVDRHDRVYVFNRGAHPLIVFDADGNLIASWGEGLFVRPHAVTMGPDDTIYLADDGDHTVRKCTLDGRVLLTIGTPGRPSLRFSGLPFNRCTHVAVAPDGSLYVTDGYGNSRIHKFSPEGELQYSWGEPGTDPGEFNIPHNICIDSEGFLYVADRENHRIQVFDLDGQFVTQWNNLYRPCGLFLHRRSSGEELYVGELGPSLPVSEGVPNLGARIAVYTLKNKLLGRLGDRLPGTAPGQFLAPHGLAVDSRGNLYVGEVSWSIRGKFLNPPQELPCLHKLRPSSHLDSLLHSRGRESGEDIPSTSPGQRRGGEDDRQTAR